MALYGMKARAFWYFTPVNPTLVFAGFEGAAEKEMYDQLPRCVTLRLSMEIPGKILNK
jgi:hypothetical protein